ncbi:hypothetical protein [Nonomuraea sp. bgisy101]
MRTSAPRSSGTTVAGLLITISLVGVYCTARLKRQESPVITPA